MAFYDSIKLEKGMYRYGSSLTDVLESLDPSEAYKGSELEGLDAYQRQLKRFVILCNLVYRRVNNKISKCHNLSAVFFGEVGIAP